MKAAVPITTRGAGADRLADGLDGRAAPAVLDRHAGVRGDPLEVLEVHRRPSRAPSRSTTCSRRAPRPPSGGGVERVGVVLLAAPEVALLEPHRLAAEDVDGGVERGHSRVAPTAAQIDVKFRSSWRPWALDFSGWNWTP